MRRAADQSGSGEAAPLGVALEFLRQLWAVDHGLAQLSKRMERLFGVTGPQRLAVRIMGRRPGIAPGELAALLHVERGAATGLLKRLASKRLITRVQDRTDARRWHLSLTPEGRRIDRIDRGTIEAQVRQVLEGSTPEEVASAARVMARLTRALSTGDGGDRPADSTPAVGRRGARWRR